MADSTTCASLVSDIPSDRVNTDLVLTTQDDKRDYTIQEDLRFFADNYSDDVLEIMPDNDIKVYMWNGVEWIQIKNKLDYLLRVSRFGPKSLDDPGKHIYYVFYDRSLVQEPTRFCVVLRAVKDPENNHLEVGSYVEIKISP